MDPVLYMLTYGASFVAQTLATNVKMTAQMIKDGMEHRGFSFISVLSQCPTFNLIDDAKSFKGSSEELQENHDVGDIDAAMHVVNMGHRTGRTPVGLLFRQERQTLDEHMAELVKQVGGNPGYDLRKIIDLSRP